MHVFRCHSTDAVSERDGASPHPSALRVFPRPSKAKADFLSFYFSLTRSRTLFGKLYTMLLTVAHPSIYVPSRIGDRQIATATEPRPARQLRIPRSAIRSTRRSHSDRSRPNSSEDSKGAAVLCRRLAAARFRRGRPICDDRGAQTCDVRPRRRAYRIDAPSAVAGMSHVSGEWRNPDDPQAAGRIVRKDAAVAAALVVLDHQLAAPANGLARPQVARRRCRVHRRAALHAVFRHRTEIPARRAADLPNYRFLPGSDHRASRTASVRAGAARARDMVSAQADRSVRSARRGSTHAAAARRHRRRAHHGRARHLAGRDHRHRNTGAAAGGARGAQDPALFGQLWRRARGRNHRAGPRLSSRAGQRPLRSVAERHRTQCRPARASPEAVRRAGGPHAAGRARGTALAARRRRRSSHRPARRVCRDRAAFEGLWLHSVAPADRFRRADRLGRASSVLARRAALLSGGAGRCRRVSPACSTGSAEHPLKWQ